MTEQTTQAETEFEPFVRFLRAHAAVVRELSSELVAAHGLTINDYEVLMRLEGLERAGYVERVACKEDLRVSYAQLTPAGRTKLRAAGKTHVAGIHRLFLDHFGDDERAVLGELLGRLAEGDDGEPCAPE
jgi:hypothetical protein